MLLHTEGLDFPVPLLFYINKEISLYRENASKIFPSLYIVDFS